MHVYGEVAVFSSFAEAETYLFGLTRVSPPILGWYGFYHERGEQVTAISSVFGVSFAFEYSGGIKDIKMIDSSGLQTRWLGQFWILEVADFEDLSSWLEPTLSSDHERGPSRGSELVTWFLVTRYWGFATRVGANKFYIFGG